MLKTIKLAAIAAVLALCLTSRSDGATVDFESVSSGAMYGQSVPHSPNQVVLIQDGIEMSVVEFVFGTFTGFFDAEVGGIYADQFATQALQFNNLGVSFDFSNVGFSPVDFVSFEFKEFGGVNNFSVNGATLFELDSLNDIPTNVAPNVTAAVTPGLVTLTGDIQSFRVGGQELAIDNVTVLPEPSTMLFIGLGAAICLRRTRRIKQA